MEVQKYKSKSKNLNRRETEVNTFKKQSKSEKQLARVKPGTAEHRNTEHQNTETVKFRNTEAPEQQKFLIWYKF